MYTYEVTPIDPPGEPYPVLPDENGEHAWVPDTPGIFQVTVTDGAGATASQLVTVEPLPETYDPPGPLPSTEKTRELIEGDGYTAAVGRQLLYDEPVERWPKGVAVENVTLYAQRRLLHGQPFEGLSVPCVGVSELDDGRLRLRVDLPATAGHRAEGERRPGYYDASLVAALDGGPVTLATEAWVVRSPSRELAEAQE
ncbi:hypothetical protein [Alienimonas sp. DA493]|uniref:hypothetical protein n=1 Tax=Alienimonas sp. DA493 TaxID=3373605 RepID=UPI0037542AAB